MNLLNEHEMALLNAAIEEEATKGIAMHSWPHQEAAHLYEMAQLGNKRAFSALKDVLTWWEIYFNYGYEKAEEHKNNKIAALLSGTVRKGDGTGLLQ